MRIYVASSWRNTQQPIVVAALRAVGHLVYDFRNPGNGNHGFHWSEIDPDWKQWTPLLYRQQLSHHLAEEGFRSDMNALESADVVVAVQPFGRSTALELGWACGARKETILLLENGEPELMVKMCDYICVSLAEVQQILARLDDKKVTHET